MRYLLGSSFFDGGKQGPEFRRAFVPIWHANVAKFTPQPSRVVVISEGGSQRPNFGWGTDVVRLTGNCGHCEQLVKGERENEFSGWSATMTALAMIAYADMANFAYLEEDCLCFGDCIGQAYRDMGDGDMVFGRKMTSPPWQPCSQAFFIVRHKFIPTFVSTYLGMGGERSRTNLGEAKFCAIEQKFGPRRIRRLSFPCDRERPIPWEAPVWFCQQWTPAELDEARRRILL
jgi:hypothetical protein